MKRKHIIFMFIFFIVLILSAKTFADKCTMQDEINRKSKYKSRLEIELLIIHTELNHGTNRNKKTAN